MLRLFSIIITLCLLLFQFSIDAECQTIKERSDLAYTKLGKSSGSEKIRLLCELAFYRSSDSMDRAKELAWEAYNYSITIKQETDIANAFLTLARVYSNTEMIDSVRFFLTRSQQVKNALHDFTEFDRLYFYWGLTLQRSGDYQGAAKKYQIALKYAQLANNDPLQARCYTELANCQKFLNENAPMNHSIESAFHSLKKGGDSLLLSNAYGHLGILMNDLGRLEDAVFCFIQAVRIAEVVCDSLALGYLYSNLAGVYVSFSLPGKANEYNLKALNIFKKTGNRRGMAYALNSLGITATGLKENAKALKYYLEAGQLKVEVGDWQGACFIYNNIADLFINSGKLTLAARYLEIAEFYTEKAGDVLSRVVYYNSSGQYYSAMQDHTRARSFFEKSLYLAETAKLHDFITSNLESISNEYAAEGIAGEALVFYKKFNARKDSVERLNDRKAIAEMQVKYDTEKKESQLSEMARLIRNSPVSNRSLFLGNIAIGTLILIVFLIFYFRSRYRMKIENASCLVTTGDLSVLKLQNSNHLVDQASKTILTPEQQDALWVELNQLMTCEKLYLNGNLKLSDLANRLNTNTSYLSNVINEISGENFCNYLNHLRVSEARVLLADPGNQHLTIEGIAQSVGFNSKSAFNTSFKKYTQQTPSEFLSATISTGTRSSLN